MMTEAMAQARNFVSQWFTKLPMIFRLLVKMIRGTKANGMPKDRMTWLNTSAAVGLTPNAIMASGGIIVMALLT